MGRKKDAERRKRREQRMAERMQQTQPQQDLYSMDDQQEAENVQGIVVHDVTSADMAAKVTIDGKGLGDISNINLVGEKSVSSITNTGNSGNLDNSKYILEGSKERIIFLFYFDSMPLNY